MPSNISFNPMLTTNVQGSFSVSSEGLVQGTVYDDPAIRNSLAIGPLATSEVFPMWGGVGIYENIPLVGQNALGPQIGRASTLANLTGFSTFNQAHAWINTPASECPSAGAGMTIPFFRLGSGARLAVQMDPSLVSLDGSLITTNVSWDFNQQRLIPYYPTSANNPITAMSWANTNGGTVTVTTTNPHNLAVGNDVTVSGAVPTAYNGDWTVASIPSSTQFTYLLPATVTPGTVTTLGTVPAGGGALNVKILETLASNCKVVQYDAVNNLVHWNNNGACAVIQL